MATTKIDIQKALNPVWLFKNKFTIRLPSNKVHRARLLKVLFYNIPSDSVKYKIELLLKTTDKISERTLYKLHKEQFRFTQLTVGKKIIENEELLQNYIDESFIIEVIENSSNMPKYHFRLKANEGDEIKILQKHHIDPKKVEEIRESEIIVETVARCKTQDEKENLAKQICHYLATGMCDLNQACAKYGVASNDFLTWMSSNETIKEMMIQALDYSKWQRSISNGLALDTRIEQMLNLGYVETETINYRRVFTQFHRNGLWMENTKTVSKRAIDEKGAALLHGVITQTKLPQIMLDEFETLSQEEQYELIMSMQMQNDKMRKKLKE